MSTTIIERNLEFVFNDAWSIRRHDGSPEGNALLPIPGTKVADFIGSYDARIVVFFEVKDPRGHETAYAANDLQNSINQQLSPEAESVAAKFRDAGAAVVFCSKVPGFDALYMQLADLVAAHQSEIALVLWHEIDEHDHRWAAACSFFWTRLKQLLAKVIKASPPNHPKVFLLRVTLTNYQAVLSGLQVNDLAGGVAPVPIPVPVGP